MSAVLLAGPRRRRGTVRTGFVVALCLLLSLGVQIALLAAPLLTMHVFDGVLQSRNGDTLIGLGIGYGVLVLLGGVLRYLRAALVSAATEGAGRRLQLRALGAATRGALAGDRARGLAALGDAAEVRRLLGGAVASDMLDLLIAPAAIAFLFVLHPLYGWTALAGCLLLGLLGALADRTTRGLVRAATAERARAGSALTGRLRAKDLTEGLGMLPAILRRWRPEGARALDLSDAAQRRARAIGGLATLSGLLLQMAMVTVGAWLLSRRDVTPGSLLAATMLAGIASAPVARVVATWRDWAFGAAAWQRLGDFVRTHAPPAPAAPAPDAGPGLQVAGLTIETPDGARVLVRGLDLDLPPGCVLGLRGANGAGKSSLLRALLGIAPAASGRALLDGDDTRAPSMPGGRAALGARIGYLPQGAQLLHGSVLDNIRRFTDAPAESAVEAARRVGAHDAIGRLRDGYDSAAGASSGLSGGQRQAVALARAFFGAPRLLALDEPEAGLDAAAIRALRAAVLRARAEGAVILLVTHDPEGWTGVVTRWLDLEPGGAWRLSEARPAETSP
ncbi:ATP-binding cassette domain-containing protein [Muricoccus radiodurans]|uniref:ATP-binding cassette domain-containing protein n=1 Tax=Muricoccus radiodurans TaxID=2231721 RepID=UPI003CE6B78C